jgi:ABC-2 type transport system ATP-binding protein
MRRFDPRPSAIAFLVATVRASPQHNRREPSSVNVTEFEKLTRRYGRRLGVNELTLCVPAGSLYGFLGPNGAGKTTAIRVLLGMLRATSGHARVFGMNCWRDSSRIKRDIGYVPGDLRLYGWMSCRDAVKFAGRVRGADLTRAGDQLAEQFGLEPTVRAGRMSRGMRQKLGLILAMVHRPRLLILDEPSTGLDPIVQETLKRHLQSLAADGHTVFFSSHTLSEVEQLCDRVAILRDGCLVAEDSLEQLRERARQDVVVRFSASATLAGLQPPACLRVEQYNGHEWRGNLTGPVRELIAWAATQPIADLSIDRPDLETLFRRYYEQGGRNA